MIRLIPGSGGGIMPDLSESKKPEYAYLSDHLPVNLQLARLCQEYIILEAKAERANIELARLRKIVETVDNFLRVGKDERSKRRKWAKIRGSVVEHAGQGRGSNNPKVRGLRRDKNDRG